MIKLKNITKIYKTGNSAEVKALNGISLEINQGELVFIMGKSGSGKSTLLHITGGLDKPTSGTVEYDDTEITHMNENQLSDFRRSNIGFVFQDYNLIPELNAEENIKYPALLAKKRIDADLWSFLIASLELKDRLSHFPYQLSGGQQQRVAIARALLTDPCVVLCDEPTGNLDSRSACAVQQVLFELNRELKKTVIIVTHDMEFANKGSGRIVNIRDGEI